MIHCKDCDATYLVDLGKMGHNDGCENKRFEGCEMIIGPTIARQVHDWSKQQGASAKEPWSGLTWNDIRDVVPHEAVA
jgi:hypothetical protein